jgi:hypothetical protein
MYEAGVMVPSSPKVFTLLDETRAVAVPAAVAEGEAWLAPGVLGDALGWHLEVAGLCRGSTCIPVRDWATLVGPDGIRLSALAALVGRPLAVDLDERAACLGASAAERGSAMQSLDAPDFTLPDLDGRPRALHEFRERKVFLLAWASW